MNNTIQKTVLDEYIPLIVPCVEIYIDMEEELGLSYSHFEWCRKEDVENDGDYMQTFEQGDSLELMGYSGLYGENIDSYLKGRPFRLPDVSFAFGGKSLVLSDKAWSVLTLSKKMGVTSGSATLTDPTGREHPGYHYLSFYNPLAKERAVKRFQKIPEQERPFIYLELKKFREMVMIHKSVCKKWNDLGINCFVSELPEEYHNLKKLGSDAMYFSSHEMLFDSLDDWQDNNFEYSEMQL